VSRTASGSFTGNETLAAVEVGYREAVGTVTAIPTVGFAYVHATQGGFVESGASSLDLNVAAQGTDSFRGLLGVRLEGPAGGNDQATPMRWSAYGGYSREFSSPARQVTARLWARRRCRLRVWG